MFIKNKTGINIKNYDKNYTIKRMDCDRHPENSALKIVDCGAFHRLCESCVKEMAENGGNLCPICHQKNQQEEQDDENLAKMIAVPSKLVYF